MFITTYSHLNLTFYTIPIRRVTWQASSSLLSISLKLVYSRWSSVSAHQGIIIKALIISVHFGLIEREREEGSQFTNISDEIVVQNNHYFIHIIPLINLKRVGIEGHFTSLVSCQFFLHISCIVSRSKFQGELKILSDLNKFKRMN